MRAHRHPAGRLELWEAMPTAARVWCFPLTDITSGVKRVYMRLAPVVSWEQDLQRVPHANSSMR